MLKNYYPLTSFLVALIIAQSAKPFIMLIKTGKFSLSYLIASGNISLTKQLVEDLQYIIEMKDPIYDEKFKEVLGHTKLELVSGVFLGILVSIVLYFLWR